VTFLGDALYPHEPLCKQISLENQQYFIFVAKPTSHPWLFEWVAYADKINAVEQLAIRQWNGRFHEVSTYRWPRGP